LNGHKLRGLVRSKEKADAIAAHGVDAVIGSLQSDEKIPPVIAMATDQAARAAQQQGSR
jgi:hypothetical protein